MMKGSVIWIGHWFIPCQRSHLKYKIEDVPHNGTF